MSTFHEWYLYEKAKHEQWMADATRQKHDRAWGGNGAYWQTVEGIGQTAHSVIMGRTYAKAPAAAQPAVNVVVAPDYRDDETATERLERLFPRYKHGA